MAKEKEQIEDDILPETAKTQILYDDAWVDIPFKELRLGDRFRMFYDDEPVVDEAGNSAWTATSDAFVADFEEEDEIVEFADGRKNRLRNIKGKFRTWTVRTHP